MRVTERKYIVRRDTGDDLWVISGRKIVTTISEFQNVTRISNTGRAAAKQPRAEALGML